jgi:hypothetical protein
MGKAFSIAVTGQGPHLGPYITHAFKKYPKITIYDRTAAVTAFRKQEVDLGKQGYLDREGRRNARATERNLKHPPKVDVTLTFASKGLEDLKVTVSGDMKGSQTFVIDIRKIVQDNLNPAFGQVDTAVETLVKKRR